MKEGVIIQEIVQMLKDLERINKLSVACAQRDYTNAQKAEKIYRLLEME